MDFKKAINHLKKCDATLAKIIQRVGPPQIKLKRNRFLTLVQSIVSQQISGAAAKTILKRLTDHLKPSRVTAAALANETVDALRAAGVSRQKATYLIDLAQKVDRNEVKLRTVSQLSNEDVIKELTKIKGIGVWTAQMFLMFSLGRLDVFPTGDLGIQNAIKKSYVIRGELTEAKMIKISKPWAPFQTIAAWYLWQSLEVD